jgi:hypothetical protein
VQIDHTNACVGKACLVRAAAEEDNDAHSMSAASEPLGQYD